VMLFSLTSCPSSRPVRHRQASGQFFMIARRETQSQPVRPAIDYRSASPPPLLWTVDYASTDQRTARASTMVPALHGTLSIGSELHVRCRGARPAGQLREHEREFVAWRPRRELLVDHQPRYCKGRSVEFVARKRALRYHVSVHDKYEVPLRSGAVRGASGAPHCM